MDIPEPLLAPACLTANTRADFRARALAHVEQAVAEAAPHVDIDVGGTREIDATGLGVLLFVEKCARERGVGTRLLNVSPSVRNPLMVARLEHLFDLR